MHAIHAYACVTCYCMICMLTLLCMQACDMGLWPILPFMQLYFWVELQKLSPHLSYACKHAMHVTMHAGPCRSMLYLQVHAAFLARIKGVYLYLILCMHALQCLQSKLLHAIACEASLLLGLHSEAAHAIAACVAQLLQLKLFEAVHSFLRWVDTTLLLDPIQLLCTISCYFIETYFLNKQL